MTLFSSWLGVGRGPGAHHGSCYYYCCCYRYCYCYRYCCCYWCCCCSGCCSCCCCCCCCCHYLLSINNLKPVIPLFKKCTMQNCTNGNSETRNSSEINTIDDYQSHSKRKPAICQHSFSYIGVGAPIMALLAAIGACLIAATSLFAR